MAKFPLPAFTFGVWLGNTEITFKEVTGIKATIEYKRDPEGGENLSHSKIPERVKFDPVILKKGLVQDSSLFRDLIKDKFNIDITTPGNNLIPDGEIVSMQDVSIFLLNPSNMGTYYYCWVLHDAYPVSWEIGNFNAQSNELMLETLTLEYSAMTIKSAQ